MIKIKTKLPGPKSAKILNKLKKLNGGYSNPHPFVHSLNGEGCYFNDLDNNTFLDFASQISSNPLGYNNKELNDVISKYKKSPIKYAGQDFTVKEHLDLIEELLTICPKEFNSAFLINSGAEAVENAIKICLRNKKTAKFGISFENAFHGRTLGALSCTNSKAVQKKNFFEFPMRRLPFDDSSPIHLQTIINNESSENIGFLILEHVQGEGGYNVADKKMVAEIRKICKENNIPYIADEVQSGLARTGKWWSYEHFNIKPDVFTSAKALQMGAVVSNRKNFPKEQGSISSTWGGGHVLDLALGLTTIKIIKKNNLLKNINNLGLYLEKRMKEININLRGLGLMRAFDLKNEKQRNDFILKCFKNGLIILGCGTRGIRLIPPYIVSKSEIDEAVNAIEKSLKNIN